MPKPITSDEFGPIIRSLMRIVAYSWIENAAIQSALFSFDPRVAVAIGPAREELRKQWKPLLDNLEQSTPESLIDILQKFEGPVQ